MHKHICFAAFYSRYFPTNAFDTELLHPPQTAPKQSATINNDEDIHLKKKSPADAHNASVASREKTRGSREHLQATNTGAATPLLARQMNAAVLHLLTCCFEPTLANVAMSLCLHSVNKQPRLLQPLKLHRSFQPNLEHHHLHRRQHMHQHLHFVPNGSPLHSVHWPASSSGSSSRPQAGSGFQGASL